MEDDVRDARRRILELVSPPRLERCRLDLTEPVAEWVLRRMGAPVNAWAGGLKLVVAFGNGDVARIFRHVRCAAEDPASVEYICSPDRLEPREVHKVGDCHVEIMETVAPAGDLDSMHLDSCFREQGMRWTDSHPGNAGITRSGRVVMIDGALAKMQVGDPRFYCAVDSRDSRPELVFVAARGNPGEARYFLFHADAGDWREDAALRRLFSGESRWRAYAFGKMNPGGTFGVPYLGDVAAPAVIPRVPSIAELQS